jgi:predicted nuclease of restriction endonuclease-like (RecB) superfamily
MAVAFHEISSAVARFKKMNPNSLQFLEVQRSFDERLACYKEIDQEKKKAIVHSSLDKFIR